MMVTGTGHRPYASRTSPVWRTYAVSLAGLSPTTETVLRPADSGQDAAGADAIAAVFVHRVQVVVGGIPARRGAVGEGVQDVRGDLADEGRRGPGDPVRLVAEDRLDPAHGARVEDARPAGVRVIGRVAVAADALADQRGV